MQTKHPDNIPARGRRDGGSRHRFTSQKGQRLHRHPKHHQGSFGGPPLAPPAPTGDGMEGGFWDQTLAVSKGDLDTSALSEAPSPALAIPSSRSSKAKSGQRNGGCSSLGPAPSPQTAPRGAASKGESRDRTRSPQPPWRHHERWGQCTELLSGGIRNGAGQSSGDSRQRAAGAWGRPARGAGTSPSASGSPAPGWERSAWRGLLWGHPKPAVPRAGSAR